jgi:hypothetical protein
MKHMKKLTPLFAFALALGCTPDGPEEGPHDEACEHAEEGPFLDVIAAAEGETAPDVSTEHTAYRVETIAVGDSRGGRVTFVSGEATDYNIYLSVHADIVVTDSAGAAVEIEETVHEVAKCEELAMVHTVELGVGTYVIAIGPTTAETVLVVIEEAAHDDHDDDHDD